MPIQSSWNEEREALLIELWNQDLSVTEIAKRLDVERGNIAGKVHRMRKKGAPLSSRPSPIKRIEGLPAKKERTYNGPTKSLRMIMKNQPQDKECLFPMWDDNTPPSKRRYCGGSRIHGSSYCEHHTKLTRSKTQFNYGESAKKKKLRAESNRKIKEEQARINSY